MVGTTNANVTIDKLGIISSQQGRLVKGCGSLDQIVATTFEEDVKNYFEKLIKTIISFYIYIKKVKDLYNFTKYNWSKHQ